MEADHTDPTPTGATELIAMVALSALGFGLPMLLGLALLAFALHAVIEVVVVVGAACGLHEPTLAFVGSGLGLTYIVCTWAACEEVLARAPPRHIDEL